MNKYSIVPNNSNEPKKEILTKNLLKGTLFIISDQWPIYLKGEGELAIIVGKKRSSMLFLANSCWYLSNYFKDIKDRPIQIIGKLDEFILDV